MSLIPRDSWSEIHRVFDHLPKFRAHSEGENFSPRVDVVEKATAFEVIADLPGVNKQDINVTCAHGVLTIEAQTSNHHQYESEDKVIHKERFEGVMKRSFTLGEHLEWQDIYAEFEDGVLLVAVPKSEGHQDYEATVEIH